MTDITNMANIFQWPNPNAEQMARVNTVLTAASAFYSIIVSSAPGGEARKQAIDRMIEGTFWALKAILNPPIPR